jgi:hypothetical protein
LDESDDSDSDFLNSGEALCEVTDNSSIIESNNDSGTECVDEPRTGDETEKEDATGGWAAQKDLTKDIRLCGKTDTGIHPTKKKTVKGWYCKFCL